MTKERDELLLRQSSSPEHHVPQTDAHTDALSSPLNVDTGTSPHRQHMDDRMIKLRDQNRRLAEDSTRFRGKLRQAIELARSLQAQLRSVEQDNERLRKQCSELMIVPQLVESHKSSGECINVTQNSDDQKTEELDALVDLVEQACGRHQLPSSYSRRRVSVNNPEDDDQVLTMVDSLLSNSPTRRVHGYGFEEDEDDELLANLDSLMAAGRD